MRMKKGTPFMHIEADHAADYVDVPVFSEAFLYGVAFGEGDFGMTKGDARFILGVAEEYAHIIELLGPDKVRELLETHGSCEVTFTVTRRF